jgi:hypothetical protein
MDRNAGQRRPARIAVPAVLAVLAVLAGGCSGESPGPPAAQRTSASASASATAPATTSAPTPTPTQTTVPLAVRAPDRTVVLDQAAPAALSIAVSRELFASAPLAVVAEVTDRTGAAAAATRSQRLGVPLLLADPAGLDPLVAELRRLGAGTVLAVGRVRPRLAGISVLTDPDAVPAVSKPPGLCSLAVLVRSDGGALLRAGAAAATATARAAGARVVGVRGGDPRTDPAAIAALTAIHPHRVLAAGPGFGAASRLTVRAQAASTGVQLPGGGQVLFPGRRLVALYGHPGTGALGVLGEQGLDASIARARAVAAPYAGLSDVPVIPAFEIIATVASAGAGPDGNYSAESTVDQLRPWVEKASAAGLYVVLDLQPGRTSFLTQARLYAPLLALPNVGLALDPEWRLAPGQVHLKQIGSVASSEINAVGDYLAKLTASHHLPQKLLVLHQFKTSMIRNEAALNLGHDELAVLIHMDGQGAQGAKNGTWAAVKAAAPPGVVFGWKNFYDEDKPVLTPAQTMAKRPVPVMISYQ